MHRIIGQPLILRDRAVSALANLLRLLLNNHKWVVFIRLTTIDVSPCQPYYDLIDLFMTHSLVELLNTIITDLTMLVLRTLL